jgi:hypothetical protein
VPRKSQQGETSTARKNKRNQQKWNKNAGKVPYSRVAELIVRSACLQFVALLCFNVFSHAPFGLHGGAASSDTEFETRCTE